MRKTKYKETKREKDHSLKAKNISQVSRTSKSDQNPIKTMNSCQLLSQSEARSMSLAESISLDCFGRGLIMYKRSKYIDLAEQLNENKLLEQYDFDADDLSDEVEFAGERDEEEEQPAAVVVGDEVEAVKKKRRVLTPDLVISEFGAFSSPAFVSLSEANEDGKFKLTPHQWLSRLMKLYENWASAFPTKSFDEFLKRCETFSSQEVMKRALIDLQRRKEDYPEEEEDDEEEEQEQQQQEQEGGTQQNDGDSRKEEPANNNNFDDEVFLEFDDDE